MSRPTGYILHEDSDRVVIATGFGRPSTNTKTASVIQVWILAKDQDPIQTIKGGLDSVICGDCKHAGPFGRRTCYVRIDTAPLQVWRAWKRGRYVRITDYSVFRGRVVRWGAYGDPVHVPIEIVQAVSAIADGHTGYTHQWPKAEYSAYRAYLMASTDTVMETYAAKLAGWRTFRVRPEEPWKPGHELMSAEIVCPASNEAGHKTTCAECRLCDGANGGRDRRKDIAIIVHGIGKRNYGRKTEQLIQIGGLAA